MKTYAIYSTIALILVSALCWIQYRSAELAQRDRNLEAKEFRNNQNEDFNKIQVLGSHVSTLIKQRDSILTSHASSQGRLKRQANASRARITGPPIVQDTVIVYLDSLVADLEQERDTLYITDTAAIDSLKKQVSGFSELFTEELKNSIRLENALNREKRKRFSLGVGTSYGIRGADLSISLHYSLFKF